MDTAPIHSVNEITKKVDSLYISPLSILTDVQRRKEQNKLAQREFRKRKGISTITL